MVDRLRSKIIRLAYTNPELREELLPLLKTADEGEEESEPASGGKGKLSGKFIEFMEFAGDTTVRNPDTGNTVKIKSLKGPRGKKLVQKLFQEWLAAHKDDKRPTHPEHPDSPEKAPDEKTEKAPEKTPERKTEKVPEKPPEATTKKFPVPSLKKNRYKGKLQPTLYITLGDKPKGGLRPGSPKAVSAIKALAKSGKVTEERLADIIGGPILAEAKGGYALQISNGVDGLTLKMRGPHIKGMERKLMVDDDGEPYIYNDTLVLDDDAPKGLGTKIFATQVAQAKAAGVKKIKCQAFRDKSRPEWVGYKVWPKLGYDGPIPFDGPLDPELSTDTVPSLPDDLEKRIQKAGFKKPYMVSHLYRIEGGQEWWEENGANFDATFDLSDDSLSLQVLGSYLEEKAKKEKLSTEEWMSRLASKKKEEEAGADKDDKKKRKKQHENVNLEKEDHDVLEAIWKRLRRR